MGHVFDNICKPRRHSHFPTSHLKLPSQALNMGLPAAFIIFVAAVVILLITVVFAYIHGKKVRKQQAERRQDTEAGLKISAPILSTPNPVRHPEGLRFEPSYGDNADRLTKIGPLPTLPTKI
jgi:hypothetical protein